MRPMIAALAILLTTLFAQPSFAECGGYNRVEYVRSSQHDNRTDFRLNVSISDLVTVDDPIVDIKTTFIEETGDTFYGYVLTRVSENTWEHNEHSSNSYVRIRLTNNSDGTATLRIAMRVPYTTFNNGIGYYASVRSCN